MESKKIFVCNSILRQSNGLSKFWLGFIILLPSVDLHILNEVKIFYTYALTDTTAQCI